MKRPTGALSYANVMSTLAVVLALGGGTTAIAVKKAPKGATVQVTKKSDITKKGNIRPQRVGKQELANGAIGANQLGTIVVRQQEGTGTVFCQPGERRIAGGAFAGSGLTNSNPELDGWLGGGAGPARAYILCLTP